jgi:hypothetical protein
MQVGSFGFDPSMLLSSLGKTRETDGTLYPGAPSLPPAKPAGSAASNTFLPTAQSGGLPVDSVLYLQTQPGEAEAISEPSVEDLFLEEMKKSPAERLREQILKALGETEESVAAMPPEQQQAMEKQIAELIKEKLREANGAREAGSDASLAAGAPVLGQAPTATALLLQFV